MSGRQGRNSLGRCTFQTPYEFLRCRSRGKKTPQCHISWAKNTLCFPVLTHQFMFFKKISLSPWADPIKEKKRNSWLSQGSGTLCPMRTHNKICPLEITGTSPTPRAHTQGFARFVDQRKQIFTSLSQIFWAIERTGRANRAKWGFQTQPTSQASTTSPALTWFINFRKSHYAPDLHPHICCQILIYFPTLHPLLSSIFCLFSPIFNFSKCSRILTLEKGF